MANRGLALVFKCSMVVTEVRWNVSIISVGNLNKGIRCESQIVYRKLKRV